MQILGRWDEAISAAESAIRGYAAAGIREATAAAHSVQGVALVALGRPDEALKAFETACSHASQMENPLTEGVCLFNTAWAYWVDGQYASAAETAERADLSLSIAGAAEADAARALAEAATALTAADAQAAADGLCRSAGALGMNAAIIKPSWLVAEAQRVSNYV